MVTLIKNSKISLYFSLPWHVANFSKVKTHHGYLKKINKKTKIDVQQPSITHGFSFPYFGCQFFLASHVAHIIIIIIFFLHFNFWLFFSFLFFFINMLVTHFMEFF